MAKSQKLYYVHPVGEMANRIIFRELSRRGHEDDRETIKLQSGEDIECWIVNERTAKALEQTRRDMRSSQFTFQVFVQDDNDRIRDVTFLVKQWEIGKPRTARARVERASNLAASK